MHLELKGISMKLADFIAEDAIVPELQATERDTVIQELLDSLIANGAVDAALKDSLFERILQRENKGSTGFGKGVAVPHVKHESVTKMAGTLGVSAAGVDFNALDKSPVFSVVLLVSPQDQPDEHLQAMEKIFRNLQKDTFRRFLRQATNRDSIVDLIREADSNQLAV